MHELGSKVKVTDRGQMSKMGLIEHVLAINFTIRRHISKQFCTIVNQDKGMCHMHVWATNSLCFDRFQNNYAELITRIRRCITCMNWIHRNWIHKSKVNVTDRGQRSKMGLTEHVLATNFAIR